MPFITESNKKQSKLASQNLQKEKEGIIINSGIQKLPSKIEITKIEPKYINPYEIDIRNQNKKNSIEPGATKIEAWAYYKAGIQGNISLDKSITAVGYHAFDSCVLLDSINWELPSFIGPYAFYGCAKLQHIIYMAEIKEINIADHAFDGCSSLSRFSETSQSECLQLSGKVFLGNYAFRNCAFQSLVTSDNLELTQLGKGAFSGCKELRTVDKLMDQILVIPDELFNGCENLGEVSIKGGVKTIPDNFCINCSALKKVVIPSSVTEIGSGAFVGCNLEGLIISRFVTRIGIGAFSGQDVEIDKDNEHYRIDSDRHLICRKADNTIISALKDPILFRPCEVVTANMEEDKETEKNILELHLDTEREEMAELKDLNILMGCRPTKIRLHSIEYDPYEKLHSMGFFEKVETINFCCCCSNFKDFKRFGKSYLPMLNLKHVIGRDLNKTEFNVDKDEDKTMEASIIHSKFDPAVRALNIKFDPTDSPESNEV